MNLFALGTISIYAVIGLGVGICIKDNINVSSAERTAGDKASEAFISLLAGLLWPVALTIIIIGTIQSRQK